MEGANADFVLMFNVISDVMAASLIRIKVGSCDHEEELVKMSADTNNSFSCYDKSYTKAYTNQENKYE